MSKNKVNIPEARAALDKFKMEAANEVGVTLKQGYNGDITSKQAGGVGGRMVNDICTVRPFAYALSFLNHFSDVFPVKILMSSFAVSTSMILTKILSIYFETNSLIYKYIVAYSTMKCVGIPASPRHLDNS